MMCRLGGLKMLEQSLNLTVWDLVSLGLSSTWMELSGMKLKEVKEIKKLLKESVCIKYVSGLLTLNITWRGKSFMGTLMDCSTTEHGSEWATPWWEI